MTPTLNIVELAKIPNALVESRDSAKSTGALFFMASLFSGIVYLLLSPLSGIGPGPESLNLARSLASHGTFADPYHAMPTGYSAHLAPLYPLLLAAVLRLFGGTVIFSVVFVAWHLVAPALMVAV